MTYAATSTGGGALFSITPLFIICAIACALLLHRGVSKWLRDKQGAVREHLYGPEHLHEKVAEQITPMNSDAGAGDTAAGSETEVDDDFDYDIYA